MLNKMYVKSLNAIQQFMVTNINILFHLSHPKVFKPFWLTLDELFQTEIEDRIARIKEHKGVKGLIIVKKTEIKEGNQP